MIICCLVDSPTCPPEPLIKFSKSDTFHGTPGRPRPQFFQDNVQLYGILLHMMMITPQVRQTTTELVKLSVL